jgi:hypothetical protein
LSFGVIFGERHQHAHLPYSIDLLTSRVERPKDGSATDKRDELTPSHSITRSARPGSASGSVTPSALAALRLTTISTLVAGWTGKSAGRCCARAVSGHPTTTLPKNLMNSRRLMGSIALAENHLRESLIRSSTESHAPHRAVRQTDAICSDCWSKRTLTQCCASGPTCSSCFASHRVSIGSA